MTGEKSYENGLCVSIFLKNMGWYMRIIGKFDNNECIVYIFTVKVENAPKIIFNEKNIIVGIKN